MKKTLALTAASALTLTLAACGSGASKDESGLKLTQAGKLTVCTNSPYAPFEYEENGKIVGLDADIASAIASQLGLEASMLSVSFEGIESGVALSSGQCDIALAGISVTPERSSVMTFSEVYFKDNLAILVPAGSNIKSPEDLAGKKVGVQQATSGEDYAQKAGADVIQYEDYGLIQQAIQTGQIEAVVGNLSVLSQMLTSDSSLSVAAEIESGEEIAAAVAQDQTQILEAANKTIKAMQEDGRMTQLQEKYIGAAQQKQ